MIDALISVVDRLIQLKKYQTERTRYLFEKLFEPVFNDLSIIHGNYIQILTQLAQQSPFAWERNSPHYLAEIKIVLNSLQESRIEMEPARRQIRFMTKELSTVESTPEAKAFVNTAISYLFGITSFGEEDEDLNDAKFKSISETILDSLLAEIQSISSGSEIESATNSISEIDIKNLIESTLEKQRHSWNVVCDSFSKLKVSVAMKD
ncbi:hypothetical protein ACQ4N7_23500 [Nodosilinea sp. AN01ver1]|uniref:hypothetical protein n=1 Tax=Nodosilinea sp. AN01ver1 TaxID=3423362 RepID=UPI003D3140D0